MKKFIALLTLALMLVGLVGCAAEKEPASKTFKKGEYFSITLNENFEVLTGEDAYEGYYVCYSDKYAHVLVLREAFDELEGLEDVSLEDYIEASMEFNEHDYDGPIDMGDYQYSRYTEIEDGETVNYMVAYYKGADGFYAINFLTYEENMDKYSSLFSEWAGNVNVG